MRDTSLKDLRDEKIVQRYRKLVALKKYRVDYIMTILEQEFFVKSKTIYGIIKDAPAAPQKSA